MVTISDLAPPLTAGHIPRCFACDGLTQVIGHIVPEAGGEAELGAGRGGEEAGDEQETEGHDNHDVTELCPRRLVTGPHKADQFIGRNTCHVPLPPSTRYGISSQNLDSGL